MLLSEVLPCAEAFGVSELCRVGVGVDSPEIAHSLLQQGWYQSQYSSDIWALGQLMLLMVAGQPPEAQCAILDSDAYLADLNSDPWVFAASPAQRQHYQYLSDLLQGRTADYATQVSKRQPA